MGSGVPTRMQQKSKNKKPWLALLVCIAVIAIVIAIIFFCSRSGGKPANAEDAYIELINGLDYPEGYNDYPYLNYLRFSLGYVDNDDIPELFLAHGDSHADQISVYTYDPSSKSVQELGDYGSFGVCGYYERQDVIWGQYGGQGLWLNYYEGPGENGKRSVLAVEGSNARQENYIEYYWASPYEDSVDEGFDITEYVVSEDEWRSNCSAFLHRYSNGVDVAYSSMAPYSEDSFRAAWPTTK